MHSESKNNKITNANFSYDAAGNLTASPVGYSYTWNAEGRMATAVAGGVTYTYTYNGPSSPEAQRVKKAAASAWSYDKLYWYGLGGEVLAESDLAGTLTSEYIFMGATRLARRDASSGNVYYFLGDRLGNARLVVNSTGVIQEESDMLPYGTERAIPHTPDSGYAANNYKFTSHERDGESGLDHTLERQLSGTIGRWLCPDRVRGRPSNPQTWNRFAYVENGPTNAIDPDGAETYHCTTRTLERWNGDGWTVISSETNCNCVNCSRRGGGDAADEAAVAAASSALAQNSVLEEARGLMRAALDAAKAALGRSTCGNYFRGRDPAELLEDMVAGSSEGSFDFTFDEQLVPPPADAKLNVDGANGSREEGYDRVDVYINPINWIRMGATERARLLIHELGHVFEWLRGAGGSDFEDDAGDPAANDRNRTKELICIPGN